LKAVGPSRVKQQSSIRTIVYTGYDLAESIRRIENTPQGLIDAEVSFQYGVDRSMIKRSDGVMAQNSCPGGADSLFCSSFESNTKNPTPQQLAGLQRNTIYIGNVEFIT
jgi:hypothetical protein